ncbi:MAG: tetratricopeptide repeat protein, partial [Methylocystis sp.]|nr:tetratricopeptide repeat protein [Methylocystis sp.]
PNVKAAAALARLHIDVGNFEQARLALAALPSSARRDADVAAAFAALDNAESAQDLGEIDELRKRVESDPNGMQARFDLALALNAANHRDEAADALLEIIRRDRSWREDGARKQLVQFFDAWGPTDKATVAARRRLSTLLFS